MTRFRYLCTFMRLKRTFLILEIGFLLFIFGAATFYFQYATIKKSDTALAYSKQSEEKTSGATPLGEEEESKTSSTSEEEEERNDDRALHESLIDFTRTALSVITPSTSHLLCFKEIHFEVLTPPPQV